MEKTDSTARISVPRLVRDARSTKHSERIVLIALALRVNAEKGFSCFPSYALLAKDTLLDQKTVQRAVASLEAKDLVKRRERAYSSNIFFLNVGLLQEQAAAVKAADELEKKLAENDSESPFAAPTITEGDNEGVDSEDDDEDDFQAAISGGSR